MAGRRGRLACLFLSFLSFEAGLGWLAGLLDLTQLLEGGGDVAELDLGLEIERGPSDV